MSLVPMKSSLEPWRLSFLMSTYVSKTEPHYPIIKHLDTHSATAPRIVESGPDFWCGVWGARVQQRRMCHALAGFGLMEYME